MCEEFREKGVDAVSQLDVLSLVRLAVELARQAQCLKGEVAADEAVDMAECLLVDGVDGGILPWAGHRCQADHDERNDEAEEVHLPQTAAQTLLAVLYVRRLDVVDGDVLRRFQKAVDVFRQLQRIVLYQHAVLLPLFVAQRVFRLCEELCESRDVVQRRAHLVGHAAYEGILLFRRLYGCVAQLSLLRPDAFDVACPLAQHLCPDGCDGEDDDENDDADAEQHLALRVALLLGGEALVAPDVLLVSYLKLTPVQVGVGEIELCLVCLPLLLEAHGLYLLKPNCLLKPLPLYLGLAFGDGCRLIVHLFLNRLGGEHTVAYHRVELEEKGVV